MENLPPPETCAQCGTTLKRSARACPECGADERTGWRETSLYDGLDLPESSEDLDDNENRQGEYNEVNFSKKTNHPWGQRRGLSWGWSLVAIGLIIILILNTLGLL